MCQWETCLRAATGVTLALALGCGDVGGPGPLLTLGSSDVTLTGTVGMSIPIAQVVEVTNGGGGTLTELAIGLIGYGSGGSGWLTATLSGATAPTELTLTASSSGLPAGTYTASVPLTSSAATNSPQVVGVAFVLATAATIMLDRTSVTFTDTIETANPIPDTIIVTNGGGAPLTGLRVGEVNYGGGASEWLTVTISGMSSPVRLVLAPTLSGMSPGTYAATVPVESDVARNSPQSVSVTITLLSVPPAAPTNLTARSVAASKMSLAWVDNSENEVAFDIQRCTGDSCTDFGDVGSNSKDDVTYQDTGLDPSATYRYRVRARNTAGASAWTDPASGLTVPAAPTALVAEPDWYQPRGVYLWWQLESAADSVLIEQCTGTCASITPLVTLPGDAGAVTIIPLVIGTRYLYDVRALNASGYSGPSNYAGVTVLAPTADAAVFSASPDSNFGTTTSLSVMNNVAGGYAASLLRFDLQDVSGVTGARLYLYGSASNGSPSLEVAMADESPAWSETSVTWNTAPDLSTALSPVNVTVASAWWCPVDITEIVAGWVSAAYVNSGFRLFTPSEGAAAQFYSRERADTVPLLTVTY